MSDFSLFQKTVMRFSSGFVFAFHDIPPERLEAFVNCIRPARPVHLSELVERSKQGKSTSGLFAITVDDGVGETVRNLSRLFSARGWPATFYVPTGYLDTADGMAFQWWRWLQPVLPRRRLELSSAILDLSSPGAVEKLAGEMKLRWHTTRLESYLPLTMELVEMVLRERGLKRETVSLVPPISWKEVAELSRNDLIRFESHGISHASMSTLTEEELVSEMKHSRDRVTEHTGRPCRHLAYPFGSPETIGARVASVAPRFYDSAVTMSLGHVDGANPWLLPRIPLYPQNSKLMAKMKILLKCGAIHPVKTRRAVASGGTQE